jgi:hypothetical protein
LGAGLDRERKMGIELFFIAVVLLALFAIFDLIVGVSNDAVNFLNSSIGSRVAPRNIWPACGRIFSVKMVIRLI